MGTVHSRAGRYETMDGKPVIDKIEDPQETGAEYVRFLGTTWSRVRSSKPSNGNGTCATYTQKVLKVQGTDSAEILYLPKDRLVASLGGDVRESSKFVNARSEYELFVHWQIGTIKDEKTGRWNRIAVAEPALDVRSGAMLRKIC